MVQLNLREHPSSEPSTSNMYTYAEQSSTQLNSEDLVPSGIIQIQQNEINCLRKKNKRLLTKITNYKRVISTLRFENLISEDVEAILRNEMISADEAMQMDNETDNESTHDSDILCLSSDIHIDSIHIKSKTSSYYNDVYTIENDSRSEHTLDSTADIQENINITSNHNIDDKRMLTLDTRDDSEVIELIQGSVYEGSINISAIRDVKSDKWGIKKCTEFIDLIQGNVKCLGVNELFDCPICNKRFSWKHQLVCHIVYHYTTAVRLYECYICHKRCSDENELKVHVSTHYENRPYKCEKCQRCFRMKANLTMHARAHRIYTCDICHKEFDGKKCVKRHMRTHTRRGDTV